MSEETFYSPLDYNNRIFAYYLAQIDQQRQILQQVRQCLPGNLANHVCHCLINKQTLLVYTDSALWASQLRFYHAAMLGGVAGFTEGAVAKIQIRLMTQTTGVAASKISKANIPCPAALEIMKQQIGHVQDKTLQDSLQRLNATLQRRALRG